MDFQKAFYASSLPHVLMITNHGLHDWEITPGLPDTGGQNVFVNQFTAALTQKGFKITIVNRGGYNHPTTGELRTGLCYKDENQRILYLDDGFPEFIRKEDMDAQLPHLSQVLQAHLQQENVEVDLIISHYWDSAKLGILYNRTRQKPIPHIWIPHSLGAVKKRNINPESWEKLRIDQRIETEKQIIPEVDKIAATSAVIQQSLQVDYQYRLKPLFLPPCINPERFFPQTLAQDHPVWEFLSQRSGVSATKIHNCQIITEVSRTDLTKRKDILIKAFANIHQKHPNTLLVITIDESNQALAGELTALIQSLGIADWVAVLGSVWDMLPDIYRITDIYCTPSIMEGFGMTCQEAAATKVPVVASHLVPFAVEYLLGADVQEAVYKPHTPPLKIGQGAIIAHANDVIGFTHALDMLLSQETLREQMGENAYHITIPYFTWEHMVHVFLKDSGVRFG